MNPFAHLEKVTMVLPIDYSRATPTIRRMAREEYERIQNGLCFFCHAPLKDPPTERVQRATINEKLFPPGFLNHRVHLHHDHITHMTLGAVHSRCNGYLWQYLGE